MGDKICISIECAQAAFDALRICGALYSISNKRNDYWAQEIERALAKKGKPNGR